MRRILDSPLGHNMNWASFLEFCVSLDIWIRSFLNVLFPSRPPTPTTAGVSSLAPAPTWTVPSSRVGGGVPVTSGATGEFWSYSCLFTKYILYRLGIEWFKSHVPLNMTGYELRVLSLSTVCLSPQQVHQFEVKVFQSPPQHSYPQQLLLLREHPWLHGVV